MGLRYDEVNKTDFIEILNDLMNNSNTYKSSQLHDCYMQMMVDKLRIDTDLNFYYRSGEIVSESLGVKINPSQINSYDELLEKVEKILVQNAEENQNEYDVNVNDLKSNWGYSFSNSGMSPFFMSDTMSWKVYDSYAQPIIFELFYFAVFGKYHKDLAFAHEMAKKYLVEEDWNKPKVYKGKIDELDGLEVAFFKNGNIKVKTKNNEFWDRVEFWYKTLDTKGRLSR